jgi:hypothetical protein
MIRRRALLLRLGACYAAVALTAQAAIGGDAAASAGGSAKSHTEAGPDFNREVRPILSDKCVACHGPDAEHRQGDLRLDVRAAADDVRGAEAVLGEPLLERITSSDPDLVMPPPETGKPLKSAEVEVLRQWMAAGGEYVEHWAFTAPQKREFPAIASALANPIDAWVQQQWQAAGVAPSPRAEPHQLLRRLSLDLIGLPPTEAEVHGAAELVTPEGYAATVERLLASPHFGERWARVWLDAARYADSDGFEKDKPRDVWMYRDWVINALNADLPYDQFIIHQIAGDLLPNAGQAERVATGFLRNSMVNEEGGIDPEQFRMEAMFDRLDAIGKGVLGLTVNCAQCHNHKYDPISHTDYYRLLACLNNFAEAVIPVYTAAEERERTSVLAEINKLETELAAAQPDWPQRLVRWAEKSGDPASKWRIVQPEVRDENGQKHLVLNDGSLLAQGYSPISLSPRYLATIQAPQVHAIRLELLTDNSLPCNGPGRAVDGGCALTELKVTWTPAEASQTPRQLTLKNASADLELPATPLNKRFDNSQPAQRLIGPPGFAIDGDDLTAWGIDFGPVRRNAPRQAVFQFAEPLDASGGGELALILVQSHGGSNGNASHQNTIGRLRLSWTASTDAEADPVPPAVRRLLARDAASWSASEKQTAFAFYRTTVASWTPTNHRIEERWSQHPEGTTQLVAVERSEPRVSHRLDRGDFLKPSEVVEPGGIEYLHDFNVGADPPRLALAKWLVDNRSTTTARVVVNRMWQSYFGEGLVSTSADLGRQGAPPTHPELLDWLAVDLMEHDWKIKRLHRLIVTSQVYQQSSRVTPELLERDPANALLARGPRFRVDAEVVRDIALHASGLLDAQVGGPSVFPTAPAFLFLPPNSYGEKSWVPSTGGQQYRRGLYTFRYRSTPYPAYAAFDACTGETACVRRPRSNTPLQSLTLLNEPVFMACARALGQRSLSAPVADDAERIDWLLQTCLARCATADEKVTLSTFLTEQLRQFTDKVSAAHELMGSASTGLPRTEVARQAAWTALARVVLNLDETITKQ